MKLAIFLLLLIPSTAHAGFCWRPCHGPWSFCCPEPAWTEPVFCEESVLCAMIAEDTERGVGNVADQSQTRSSGGFSSTLIDNMSLGLKDSYLDFSGPFIGGVPGGSGGGWPGGGGGTGGSESGNGNGGTEHPSDSIPEPSGLVTWVLCGLIGLGLWCGMRGDG